MANWLDVLALVATLAGFGGTVYVILYVIQQVSQGVQTTKESLKNKGLHISGEGVSVKTTRRFDREDYVDATQRGLIKAMGASSFGHGGPNGGSSTPSTPVPSPGGFPMKLQTSESSMKTTSSAEEKKKKGILGMRKGFSSNKVREND